MKNENRTDDMVEILSYLHQYVPMQSEMTVVNVPEIEEREEIQFESLHHMVTNLLPSASEVHKVYAKTQFMLLDAWRASYQ
jgi:hypothetical protein